MAATRKATGPAPSQANASAKNSDAADISGYTELHARAEILVAADTNQAQASCRKDQVTHTASAQATAPSHGTRAQAASDQA